ncbi:MAG: rRNA adenine N-6-methyltransferase family protein [Candidatus Gracilibacteria bacterium]|nr:rRNA adenine N-6-methyltransferase family protein [Candidatus Gracilibacteria bacterium]MDD2909187.1 rRNA adenine N-6-methyltransferase family protein [Candidatus Gracilibacteria bacterium]
MKRFIKEFIKNPRTIGSVIPSSSRLIHSMLKHIDFSRDITIVEFGPGIGNFTKEILKKVSKDSHVYLFEIKDNFVEHLQKISDPRLTVIHDGAENIEKHLGGKKADYIISGLPFGSLPKELTNKILKETHRNLKHNGIFLQFQYFLQNKKDIFTIFKNHSITWQPVNFPPAFIYKCKKIHF